MIRPRSRPRGSVAVAVLAAGASRRMGRPKQLLPLRGETLLERALRVAQAARCGPVLVTLGSRADEILAAVRLGGAQPVRVDEWAEGIAASVRAVAARVEGDPGIGAVLFCAVDQPFVTPAALRALVRAYRPGTATLVGSGYAGTTGVPAIVGREHFQELGQLRGDQGARALLLRHPGRVLRVSIPAAAVDVDRPEDLHWLGEPFPRAS